MPKTIALAIDYDNSHCSSSKSYHCYMSIFEIRQANLAKLLKDRFDDNQADMANRLKTTPGYVWQLLNGNRNIGERAARNIESKLRLEKNSLDLPESGAQISEPEGERYSSDALDIADRYMNLPPAYRDAVIAVLEAQERLAASSPESKADHLFDQTFPGTRKKTATSAKKKQA